MSGVKNRRILGKEADSDKRKIKLRDDSRKCG
jgi:hypothetical protein